MESESNKQQEESVEPAKKGGILSKIADAASNAAKSVKSKYDDWDSKRQLIKHFEAHGTAFSCWENGKCDLIYGHRNIEEKTILLLLRDKDKIRFGTELSAQSQYFIVQEFDTNQVIPYQPENSDVALDCFKVYYKMKEQQVPVSNSITQNNNINVGDNFCGDINAVNQAKLLDDLKAIENELNKCKPSFLTKHKLQEANDMFVAFKSTITKNEKPDKSFVDRFVDILKVVAPAAVTLVTALV